MHCVTSASCGCYYGAFTLFLISLEVTGLDERLSVLIRFFPFLHRRCPDC